jgi:hypothetical protein
VDGSHTIVVWDVASCRQVSQLYIVSIYVLLQLLGADRCDCLDSIIS